MGENMSPADIKAVVDNNGYPYPYPYMGGFGSGFGNGDWSWIIIILILFGFGGNGYGNGGFGGFGNEYAWLSNGQKEIMQNTNQGFDTLQLANQLTSINSGVQNLSTQLCNCCGDISQQLCNSFANAEISANNRQMADMQQNFALSTQLANASADNRLGIANLNSTILAENCADREALREVGQSIIVNQNNNTQKIIDEIFRDRLDEKDSKISDLQRELQMADLRASQIAQTANIVDMTYARLRDCPIDSTPIYRKNSDI